MLKTPPLSLYIHLPWCVQKCPYCDFNSYRRSDNLDFTAYVTALLSDLRLELPLVADRKVESIFIGGGTPSLFPPAEVQWLLQGVRDLVACDSSMEVTLEANPGTLEAGRFAAYRKAGVTRLSLGVQSFNADALQRIGRIHGPGEVVRAFRQARSAGFGNINLDLMFGLPCQTVEEATRDLENAIDLAPEHISYYQLTIEPKTGFAASPPPLPTEECIWEMQQQGEVRLQAAGYWQYEVSAYAQAQYPCRHNLNYWNFGDYLGIGAGAHAKLSDEVRQCVWRRSRVAAPGVFLSAAGSDRVLAEQHKLGEADLIIEFMMNLLRLNTGFSRQLFQERTGLSYSKVEPLLSVARQRGLLQQAGEQWLPTAMGRRYLNDLLTLFI